jgi:hypothetical protein
MGALIQVNPALHKPRHVRQKNRDRKILGLGASQI